MAARVCLTNIMRDKTRSNQRRHCFVSASCHATVTLCDRRVLNHALHFPWILMSKKEVRQKDMLWCTQFIVFSKRFFYQPFYLGFIARPKPCKLQGTIFLHFEGIVSIVFTKSTKFTLNWELLLTCVVPGENCVRFDEIWGWSLFYFNIQIQ